MKSRIAFRVDASLDIGSGHLVRCCNFAKFLRKKDLEVIFILEKRSKPFIPILEKQGFKFNFINSSEAIDFSKLDQIKDASLTIEFLEFDDILIVDHYGLDVEWEKQVGSHVKTLVVIDDLANRDHICDMLIDSNFYLKKERYKKRVVEDTIVLSGPSYCIINESFKPIVRSPERVQKNPKNILLFFGGNDKFNLNIKFIDFIEKNWPSRFIFNCVVGKNSAFNNDLIKLQQVMGTRLELFIETIDMAKIMEKCDIYIGSGGSVTWERAINGLPSAVVTVADNQVESAQDLQKKNYIMYLGNYGLDQDSFWSKLNPKLTRIFDDKKLRLKLSQNSSKLVDGLGSERIFSIIKDRLLSK